MNFPNRLFSSIFVISASILWVSGCATTGLNTVSFEDESVDYFSVEDIQTSIATKTDAEVSDSDEAKDPELSVAEQRETFSSSKGYWRAALNYLQTGNEDDARWALGKALAINPKSKIANELMRQLDVDAINELGSENFDYKVQYGDSLSKLSKLYLNNALKFYLLAKYNDIADPSRLVVGQVIQIPGKSNPLEIANKEKLENTENASAANADTTNNTQTVSTTSHQSQVMVDSQEMFNAGEYLATIELLENNRAEVESNPALAKTLVNAYYEEAKKLLDKEEFIESKLLLSRAVELEPDNTEVNMMLIDMNELDHAETRYRKSLKAIERKDFKLAYDLLKQTLEIQSSHPLATLKIQEVKIQLVQYYYKQALMAQRKHELDEAIAYWDSVLELDQNNDNAKLYRAKAVNLKIKLEQFVSTQ